MGERKGQNFYYPPDFDPKKHGSLNGYHGVHALRERARKMDRGILIIRFEMPYNIWCEGCKNHIGMGVRYNAEKTKVGMYYTTPIYQFRMKCHLCTNHWIIKTDPGNLDYVIVEGATRQERRWDPTQNGQVVPDDKAVGKKLADDAMYKLEHEKKDKNKSEDAAPRIGHISDIQDRVKDDYLANRILRDQMRKGRKLLKAKKMEDKGVLERNSLNLELVDECPEDVKFAQLLSIQARKEAEDLQKEGRVAIEDTDIFRPSAPKPRAAVTRADRKAEAVNILRAAAASKQNQLLRSRGFGIILNKNNADKAKPGVGAGGRRTLPPAASGSSGLASPAARISSGVKIPPAPCSGVKVATAPSTVESCTPSTVESCTPSTVKSCTPSTVESCTPSTVESCTPSTVDTCSPSSTSLKCPRDESSADVSNSERSSGNVEKSPDNVEKSPGNVEKSQGNVCNSLSLLGSYGVDSDESD